MSKIYRVEITFDVWVQADSDAQARSVAYSNMEYECSRENVDANSLEVTAAEPEIAACLPYRAPEMYGQPDETIGEILLRNAREVKP